MAIKKRKVPKRVVVRRKLSKHELNCRDLYNRLQQDDDDSIRYVMNQLTPVEMSAHLTVQSLMAKCTTEVATLQMNGNFGGGCTFRVSMVYEDRNSKPKHGYLYRKVSAVKSSPVLIISVMLAYIEIAKQAGHFP